MKKFFCCSIIILASCGWIYTQERVIDEASYNELIQKANLFLYKASFRTRTVVDVCDALNCIWETVERSYTEVESAGKRRHFGEVMGPRGFEPLPEYRIIDDKVFIKQSGADWKIEQRKPPVIPDPGRSEAKLVFRDLGTERAGAEELRVLTRTAHVHLSANSTERENIQTIKSWIDPSGCYRKQEYFWTDSRRNTRRTIFYEVDPSIKIEAPIK
jgi:hypothetical protein